MDILCPKCGEPWEIDSIHDRVDELSITRGIRGADRLPLFSRVVLKADGDPAPSFRSVYRDFVRRGCWALGEPCGDGKASPGIALCYELNGDDVDGAAASFEDLAGLIDEMGMED